MSTVKLISSQKEYKQFLKIFAGGLLIALIFASLFYYYYWSKTINDTKNPDLAKATDATDAMGISLAISVLWIFPIFLPIGYWLVSRLNKSKTHFWFSFGLSMVSTAIATSIFFLSSYVLIAGPILTAIISAYPYFVRK